MNALPGLFEPLTINSITVPNRFVMPAMQRGLTTDGAPDPQLADYYRARILGGAGLVISESCAIDHPSATGQKAAVHIHGRAVPAWARIVGAVKNAGGHMLMQLWHEGAMRPEKSGGPDPEFPSLSPSGFVWETRRNGRAADRGELEAIRDAFVAGALTAKALGADGVELHAAHGFLLDQFFWRETNKRADGLGGDTLEERLSFPVEVVRAIREAAGSDFLIGWRFSQWKEVDFAARIFETPAELGAALGALRAAGVDLFHASTRRFYTPEWPNDDRGLAGWASALTDAPVIAIGSVGVRDLLFGYVTEAAGVDPLASLDELGRRFARGDFALAAAGRAMLADPDWVNKVRAGDHAAIRPFTRDMFGGEWDMAIALEGLARFGELQ